MSFVSPLIATVVTATVDAVQAVVDGAFGDNASLDAFVQSVVDFVPTVADGFLNGYPLIDQGAESPFPLPDVTLRAASVAFSVFRP